MIADGNHWYNIRGIFPIPPLDVSKFATLPHSKGCYYARMLLLFSFRWMIADCERIMLQFTTITSPTTRWLHYVILRILTDCSKSDIQAGVMWHGFIPLIMGLQNVNLNTGYGLHNGTTSLGMRCNGLQLWKQNRNNTMQPVLYIALYHVIGIYNMEIETA